MQLASDLSSPPPPPPNLLQSYQPFFLKVSRTRLTCITCDKMHSFAKGLTSDVSVQTGAATMPGKHGCGYPRPASGSFFGVTRVDGDREDMDGDDEDEDESGNEMDEDRDSNWWRHRDPYQDYEDEEEEEEEESEEEAEEAPKWTANSLSMATGKHFCSVPSSSDR